MLSQLMSLLVSTEIQMRLLNIGWLIRLVKMALRGLSSFPQINKILIIMTILRWNSQLRMSRIRLSIKLNPAKLSLLEAILDWVLPLALRRLGKLNPSSKSSQEIWTAPKMNMAWGQSRKPNMRNLFLMESSGARTRVREIVRKRCWRCAVPGLILWSTEVWID